MPKSDGHFKPGQSGNAAGRKAGSKNKINNPIWKIFEKYDLNPIDLAAQALQGTLEIDNKKITLTPRLFVELVNGILPYCYPKLKSIEHTVGDKSAVNFNVMLGGDNIKAKNVNKD